MRASLGNRSEPSAMSCHRRYPFQLGIPNKILAYILKPYFLPVIYRSYPWVAQRYLLIRTAQSTGAPEKTAQS